MPALSSEGEDQLVLNAADAAHNGDDTVVDLEIITEERHHHEPFQSNVETLKRKRLCISTYCSVLTIIQCNGLRLSIYL